MLVIYMLLMAILTGENFANGDRINKIEKKLKTKLLAKYNSNKRPADSLDVDFDFNAIEYESNQNDKPHRFQIRMARSTTQM